MRTRYEDVDLVIVRETSEDIYAGIEFEQGTPDAEELIAWLADHGQKIPQPDSGILWNSKRKDELETQLHTEVCSGVIDLRIAQQEIAKDWIAAYVKRFGVPNATVNRSRYRARKTGSP